MSDRAWQVLVTAVVGLALLLVLRVVLGWAFDRYVKRVAARKPPDYVARLRTRLVVLRRVIVAFVFVVVLWSVLEIFPTTEQIARTLLASGAFIALVLGVAFSVPLGNIGAGILLSLSQPVRIGDRITVGDVTGTAEEITLIHTIVRTDQGLTAFVPNSQMITSTVVNRTLDDPRRLVTVRLPVAITRAGGGRAARPAANDRGAHGAGAGGRERVRDRRRREDDLARGHRLCAAPCSGRSRGRRAPRKWAAGPRRGGLPAAVGILASCAEFASRPAPRARSTSAMRCGGSMRLYDSLTRGKVELPEPPGPIRMYVCGSTVYHRVHVGNARPFVLAMWLRSWLKRSGYDVTLVHNITDVDDKVYVEAAAREVASRDLAEWATGWFVEDTDGLGLGRPDVEPRASETMPEITAFIEELLAGDLAYVAEGDVYFRVARFEDYGRLSGREARRDGCPGAERR